MQTMVKEFTERQGGTSKGWTREGGKRICFGSVLFFWNRLGESGKWLEWERKHPTKKFTGSSQTYRERKGEGKDEDPISPRGPGIHMHAGG